MSEREFDDECPGCRPVIIDPKTGKQHLPDHPAVVATMKVWAGMTREERASFHRFTCLNSRAAIDLEVMNTFGHRLEAEVGAHVQDPHEGKRAKNGFAKCSLATDVRRFVVIGLSESEMVNADVETEAQARQLAEQRWPGCEFVITTLGTVVPSLPSHVPSVIIMAAGMRNGDRFRVHGYVLAEVHDSRCVPFTPSAWPKGTRNMMPD